MSARFEDLIADLLSFPKYKLIAKEDLLSLVGCNLEKIHAFLGKTTYSDDVSSIPPDQLKAALAEKALKQNFVRTCYELIAESPKVIGLLISAILRRIEVENILTLLRAKMAGIDLNEVMLHITPTKNIPEEMCLEIFEKARNIGDIVRFLSGTEYGELIGRVFKKYREIWISLPLEDLKNVLEHKRVEPFETALNKYVYWECWKATKKLHGIDKKIVRELLGTEIDLLNVKIALRCKSVGIKDIGGYIIPVFYRFAREDFESALRTTGVRGCLETLLSTAKLLMVDLYEDALTKALKEYDEVKSLVPVENTLKKVPPARLREYQESKALSRVEDVLDRAVIRNLNVLTRYKSILHAGFVMAYLDLKWLEIRNLRTIVKGTEDRFPSDWIKNHLILPETDLSSLLSTFI